MAGKEVDVLHSKEQLEEMQRLPLPRKIQITTARIIEWYQHYNGKVYVAFSGGKDSTVLLDIVRRIYPAFVPLALIWKRHRTVSNV